MSEKQIYIVLKRNNDRVIDYALSTTEIDQIWIDERFNSNNENEDESPTQIDDESEESKKSEDIPPYPLTFGDVDEAFAQAMLMYRKSVVETINLAPILASVRLNQSIDHLTKKRGEKVRALSNGDVEVFTLPHHAGYSINRHVDESAALVDGALHLPKIATIGIISSYDAILTDLLRVIFLSKPETIFTSEREIKFSELVRFNSIEAARESIVNNEIESVIRRSHHEQFFWMEKRFGMPLREGLDIWPDFIELCERRNLLTHTGGVVSDQYLQNCADYGRKSTYKVGEKLNVDLDYLIRSIGIITEMGCKLIHTMWRKFAPDQRSDADSHLNGLGMDLIAAKEFDTAIKILDFGVNQRQHSSDLFKRMMVVNLSNALKLSGNLDRCNRVLSKHDWSATSYQFQICVAAVRDNFEEVCRLLKLGEDVTEITPSNFRDWPVFLEARKQPMVQEIFEAVFGEELFRSEAAAETEPSED